MAQELLCSIHGPYDASYGTCPVCSGAVNRPPAPSPLSEDEMATDLGAAPMPGIAPGGGDSESPTEIPARRGGRGKILDLDDEEPTELGRGAREDVTEIEAPPVGIQGLLWVKEGHRRGRVYKIQDNAVIGRKDGNLILDDPKVSNPHAKLTTEDDQFVIWDFGSKNGTFVNGERIRGATPLDENDLVKIGDTIFMVKLLDPVKKISHRSSPAKKSTRASKKA